MTIKTYQKIKLGFTIVLAIIFSQAVIYKNSVIPLIAMIIASLILIYLRRQVKEVIADERDYAIAGRAALWSIQIYSLISAGTMIILYALRDKNSSFEPVAMTLAFSTCALMLLYSLIFNYRSGHKDLGKKLIFAALILALFVGVFIIYLAH
jgi:uncharacterized membrane protein